MDPERIRKLTIQISGEIGSGKNLIAGVIYTALKDTIPNCLITCTEEGRKLEPDNLISILETINEARGHKEKWYPYEIILDTHSPPEM